MLSVIKKTLHKIIHYLTLTFFKNKIVSRKLKGTKYRIYFQSDQFLKMFFSKEVDYEPTCVNRIKPLVKEYFPLVNNRFTHTMTKNIPTGTIHCYFLKRSE